MPNLSDLTVPAMETKRLADLRQRAASQLGGSVPVTDLPTSSAQAMDALSVLHALASSPHTASDALTLLHELQVHQVELDLQAQELRESRAQLEDALRRQIELFDFQPVGLFVLNARGVVLEVNHTGAALLGLGRDDALGVPLVGFLCDQSTGRFDAAMASITAGRAQAQCTLQLRTLHGSGGEVLASMGKDPGQTGYLVNLLFSGRQPQDPPDPR